MQIEISISGNSQTGDIWELKDENIVVLLLTLYKDKQNWHSVNLITGKPTFMGGYFVNGWKRLSRIT